MLLLEQLTRRLEGASVAVHEVFQDDGDGAEAIGLRRWRPFSPQMAPMVEERFVDDDREVGLEAALPLEFADGGVVVLAQLEADVGREIFGVVVVDPVPTADRRRDLLDVCKVLSVEVFRVHAERDLTG
jgi:hypothetical protein